jgi:hypothetical protein
MNKQRIQGISERLIYLGAGMGVFFVTIPLSMLLVFFSGFYVVIRCLLTDRELSWALHNYSLAASELWITLIVDAWDLFKDAFKE